MERKLASIQKIVALSPIPQADQILKATVLGWECVVAVKDQFHINDLVVYCEVDSILPEKPEFEFLRERKFRIKTIKLRGQVSQGIVFPLSVLPKGNYTEGQDVTGILGVRKYDPEGEKEQALLTQKAEQTNSRIQKFLLKNKWYRKLWAKMHGKKEKGWPTFIHKTDEDRIQTLTQLEGRLLLADGSGMDKLYATEKLDGQSVTYFMFKKPKHQFFGFIWGTDYEFGVCSRNIRLGKQDNSSYWQMAVKYDIENVLRENMVKCSQFIAIQGEIVGEGIQDNKYGIKGRDLYIFNYVVDGVRRNYMPMEYLMAKYRIACVPFINVVELKPVGEMVEYSKGKSVLADIPREGVVFRAEHSPEVSFKVINPDFLLKYGL